MYEQPQVPLSGGRRAHSRSTAYLLRGSAASSETEASHPTQGPTAGSPRVGGNNELQLQQLHAAPNFPGGPGMEAVQPQQLRASKSHANQDYQPLQSPLLKALRDHCSSERKKQKQRVMEPAADHGNTAQPWKQQQQQEQDEEELYQQQEQQVQGGRQGRERWGREGGKDVEGICTERNAQQRLQLQAMGSKQQAAEQPQSASAGEGAAAGSVQGAAAAAMVAVAAGSGSTAGASKEAVHPAPSPASLPAMPADHRLLQQRQLAAKASPSAAVPKPTAKVQVCSSLLALLRPGAKVEVYGLLTESRYHLEEEWLRNGRRWELTVVRRLGEGSYGEVWLVSATLAKKNAGLMVQVGRVVAAAARVQVERVVAAAARVQVGRVVAAAARVQVGRVVAAAAASFHCSLPSRLPSP